MPPKTQVNSATGIMGTTGSGKSSLGATLARYVWSRWKKVTLAYMSDGGGFPAEVQALAALGIMRVFRMQTRDPGDLGLSFETCYRSCQGWWPRRINPATGEVEPGVEMVPPVALRYTMKCPQGHVVKIAPSQHLLQPTVCPQCRKPVTKLDMQIEKTLVQNKGFEAVGAVFYDGLSSMLAWEQRELGHRAGRMELRGEEAAIGGKVESGTLKFGGTTRSHVGFVQTRGEELVHLTLGIPNLVVPPVFTMLTHEDVDDRSLFITGPKIAGRAKTDEAPQWFGNLLESAKIPALQGTGEQRVLYLQEFTDSRSVRHLLKHRGSPGTMPEMLADPPNDEAPFTRFNLGLFFELLDAALEKRILDVHAEVPDAPGLPEGIAEFGDSSVVVPSVEASMPLVAGPPTLTAPAPLQTPTATGPAPIAPIAPKPRGRPAKATQVPVGPPTMVPTAAPPTSPASPVPPTLEVSQPDSAPVNMEASPVFATPPSSPPPSAPTAMPAPIAARPGGVAPPPGRRPLATPVARPGNLGASAGGQSPTGPPANGPAMRGPAAAPRPPAAVPRPVPKPS